jgi:hypothetical protein
MRPFLVTLGISVAFGVLISNVNNLPAYCITIIVYEIFDISGDSLVVRNVYRAIKNDTLKNKEASVAQVSAIYDYYLLNPTVYRDVVLLICFFCALILYGCSRIWSRDEFELLSYGVLIVAIITGEVAIWRWRRRRNERLYSAEQNEIRTEPHTAQDGESADAPSPPVS